MTKSAQGLLRVSTARLLVESGGEEEEEEEAGGLRGADITGGLVGLSPLLRNRICEDIELLFDNNEEIVPRSNRIQE